MKHWLLILFLVPCFARAEVDPYRSLSPQDYELYLETFNKCHAGTALAAVKTSIDPAIIQSAAVNLTQILMLSLEASKQRMDSGLLSPEGYRRRHSPGYWLAWSQCYSGSSAFKINLIQQIISMGHLSSEVAGSLASFAIAGKMAVSLSQFYALYPQVGQFIAAAGATAAVYGVFSVIKKEYFSQPTPEQAAYIKRIEENMFSNVDYTLGQVVELSKLKVAEIDDKLSDPSLNPEERQKILEQRTKLISQIQKLKKKN